MKKIPKIENDPRDLFLFGIKIEINLFEIPRGLFAHNIKEFSNLAEILPEVFAENRDNF